MEKKKKIKVLRIINRFNIGGPTYNATFLTHFLSDDFETLLVGGLPDVGESDSMHVLEQYGVKPLLIEEMKRLPNFKSDRKAYLKLKEIIRDYQPDIVHTHASKAGALGRKAAIELKYLLQDPKAISKESISKEFYKSAKTGRTLAKFLKKLQDTKILHDILPEIGRAHV